MSFKIAGRAVGLGEPCFIIAEAGVAHFGSLDIARSLVDMAVEAKADAVKFQVFKTERLISHASPEWIARLKPKEIQYDAVREIQKYCAERSIMFLATAHEEESADFLEELGVAAYKIGSGELNNLPFVSYLAAKGKPLIISTGLHDEPAIQAMLDAAGEAGCREVALLHCVTAYPTPPEQANLRAIPWMIERFKCPIGYSDHTEGYEIPTASVALGATILEKHISLDKKIIGSQDSRVSCDREDLVKMVIGVRKIEAAMRIEGKPVANVSAPALLWARKSLVTRERLPKGTRLTADHLVTKRPGTGISPDRMADVLGKVAARDLGADQVLVWDDIADEG